jgi:curved DNA-binding protein CbpA
VERPRQDHYRILQVDPAANQLVVQAAYRVLARIFHPDVQGDDEQMKRLNRAWEVLGDPSRRAAYDIERAGRHVGPDASAPGATTAARSTPTRREPAPRSRTADAYAAFATNAAAHGGRPTPTTPSATAAPAASPSIPRFGDDHAGPPVGEPFGPALRFGRYEGWTLGQVSRVDKAFLEWLRSAPAGRGLRDEIDAVLRSHGISGVDRRRYDADRQQQVHAWGPGAPTKVR